MAKKLVIEQVILNGLTILNGYRDEYVFEKIRKSNDFYEVNLLNKWVLPHANRLKVIYDIGANIGNHTVFFSTKTRAEVFSFEPYPPNFDILNKNIESNNLQNVTVFNFALGGKKENLFLSLEQKNNFGTASIKSNPEAETIRTEIRVLDDLHLPLPDFVKIDVEGYEFEVLQGMKETLIASIPRVWIEVSSENSRNVFEFMKSLGYSLFDIELDVDNNCLFCRCENKNLSYGEIFEKILSISDTYRSLQSQNAKTQSKFAYEQKKAENLTTQLGQMRSKFEYEQNKAEDLTNQLSQMRSKFEFEQNKAEDLTIQLGQMRSKFEYEQNKSEDLTIQLGQMRSKFEYEQNKAEGLLIEKDQLKKGINDLSTNLNQANKKLEITIKERDQHHANLLKYKKSKTVYLLERYWKTESKVRAKIRYFLNLSGHWFYIRLLPYPRLRLIFTKINRRLRIYKDPLQVKVSPSRTHKHIIKSPGATTKNNKYLNEINVALVVDEFTYNSFHYEFNALPLSPTNWRQVFEKNDIDLFLCESAWTGIDPINHPWRGKIYCSVRFPKENRIELLEIIDYCKANNIPTAFWNKEDPIFYGDKVHNFVDTALKFDHIFTTSKECVEKYKKDFNHPSVHLLMFATQPKLFNPIEKFDRTEEIIFAGSWYKQHPSRCQKMEMILDRFISNSLPLKIYNRHSGSNDPNHIFPVKYLPYLNPSLPHDQLEIAYKSSKFALNINTITESDTMFARRVFELMSSNTLVLSNYSKGMQELFGDNVIFIDNSNPIDLSNDFKKRTFCLYEVLRYHTYSARFIQILNTLKIEFNKPSQKVAIIYEVSDILSAEKAADHFQTVEWEDKNALFLVSHECDGTILRNIVEQFNCGNIGVLSKHYCLTYNDVLNVDGNYVIWADRNLRADFINRAMLHVSYLDPETCIIDRNSEFKIQPLSIRKNVLYPIKLLEKVKKGILHGEFEEVFTYSI